MDAIRRLTPDDDAYPAELRALPTPPTIHVEGALVDPSAPRPPVVAIVGTRAPRPCVVDLTTRLAAAVASTGAIVVSGGAKGIDTAAHDGAIAARGRTWVVVPGGPDRMSPRDQEPLAERVRASAGGALIWTFEPGENPWPPWRRFFPRNSVLVALADVVVVMQAGVPSGALNAARWARDLDRPLWCVPPPAWEIASGDAEDFLGSLGEIERGARPLLSIDHFLTFLEEPTRLSGPEGRATFARAGERSDARDAWKRRPAARARQATPSEALPLPTTASAPSAAPPPAGRPPARPLPRPRSAARSASAAPPAAPAPPPPRLDPTERALLDACANVPRHIDEIAALAQVCASAAATGLLTLALENVVVEGPEGFYRRGTVR